MHVVVLRPCLSAHRHADWLRSVHPPTRRGACHAPRGGGFLEATQHRLGRNRPPCRPLAAWSALPELSSSLMGAAWITCVPLEARDRFHVCNIQN